MLSYPDMLFFLRKVLSAVALPIGITGLLVIAGCYFRRRWVALAGCMLLWTLSMPFVASNCIRPLERWYPELTPQECPAADAIVVLSGSIVRGTTSSGPRWGEGAARYFAGLQLAGAKKAQLLVFTQAPLGNSARETEGGILREAAISQGISPEHVYLTGPVGTTSDEARAVSRIAGVHSIILVTSAFHMPRSVHLFRARGLEVTPYPTDLHSLDLASSVWLVPSAGALNISDLAIHEYYGLLFYTLYSRLYGREQSSTGPPAGNKSLRTSE
jgi:uncharacterized SAM-binding protein YcdF (DUF218 family)